MNPKNAELPPVTLPADSPYRVIELIGAGAMGEVWLAEDRPHARKVVIKVMHGHLPIEAGEDRLRLEAVALSRARGPHVVQLYDWGRTTDGRPYLVMEHLQGRTLDVLLGERKWLPVGEAVRMGQQLLSGLASAHEAGIIHRDCKPSNIFVCEDGKVKLLDFGVVRFAQEVTGVSPLQVKTKHGLALGTPKYMAPEQARCQPLDKRVDLFAAGIILYQLLTGKHPHAENVGGNLERLIRGLFTENPVPPSQVAPQAIPEQLDRLVLHALAKNPEERVPNAFIFVRELVKIGASLPATAHDAPVAARGTGATHSAIATPRAADDLTVMPLSETAPLPSERGTARVLPAAGDRKGSAHPRSVEAAPNPVGFGAAIVSAWGTPRGRLRFWLALAISFAAAIALYVLGPELPR